MTPAPVSRLGFLEVRTPDVERLTAHYADTLGLATVTEVAGTRYLTTGADHHCLVLAAGEPHGRARLGFQLGCELDDARTGLAAMGLQAQRASDPEPGIAEALLVAEPLTGTPVVLYERQAPSGIATSLGSRPSKLGHLAGFVSDIAPVRAFYEGALGFRWSDMVGDFFLFLRCNADHHAINLIQTTDRTGLFHMAFEMRDMTHLKDLMDVLSTRGVRLDWGPGRHGTGHNIFTYHRDPDGNVVELFTELDTVPDERTGWFEPRPWHSRTPLGPEVKAPSPDSANLWGPQNPGGSFIAH